MTQRRCAACGAGLAAARTGRPPVYCSTECRKRSFRDRRAELGHQLADIRRRLEALEQREGRRDGSIRDLDPEAVRELRSALSNQRGVERR